MTTTSKKRAWYSQEKLEIVKSHLIGGKTVSEICEEHSLTPSLYYKWQSMLFENGAECLERKNKRTNEKTRESKETTRLRSELEKVQEKLANKRFCQS